MDRSEVARQKAEELHVALANTGVCPTQPVAFARAEAKRRNIEVEKLPQGDVRLHGGRALYDPGASLILHEDAGDDFVHAFLIAHEIGHVECGGGHEYSVTANADPLRTAEAAPVGVDRVVDYSRRQRQEVQMDLFARELLLPRSLMRRLHVEEGLTASAIAARYKRRMPWLLSNFLMPCYSRQLHFRKRILLHQRSCTPINSQPSLIVENHFCSKLGLVLAKRKR